MLKASRESKQQFANRVKTLRVQHAIKATALAKTAGVSPASVWQWEHAGAVPRKATLVRFADALSVSPDYLLKGGRLAPTITAPSISPTTSLENAFTRGLNQSDPHEGLQGRSRNHLSARSRHEDIPVLKMIRGFVSSIIATVLFVRQLGSREPLPSEHDDAGLC